MQRKVEGPIPVATMEELRFLRKYNPLEGVLLAEHMVKQSPNDNIVLYTCVRMKLNHDPTSDVIAMLDHILNSYERNNTFALYQIYQDKANTLYLLERYEEALECINKALHAREREPILHRSRDLNNLKAKILAELERYEEALPCIICSIQENPRMLKFRMRQIECLKALQRYEEALVACNDALKIAPNPSHLLHTKGLILVLLEMREEALKVLEEANKQQSTASSCELLGDLYASFNDYEKARKAYQLGQELATNELQTIDNIMRLRGELVEDEVQEPKRKKRKLE
jgi:tetratricopeptide (TPR) repeat protein